MGTRPKFRFRHRTLEQLEARYIELSDQPKRASKSRWMPPRVHVRKMFPEGSGNELLDAALACATACYRCLRCGEWLCGVCGMWAREAEVCDDLQSFYAAIGGLPEPHEATWLTVNLPPEMGNDEVTLRWFRQRWHDFRRRRLPGSVICGGFQVGGDEGYLHCHVVVWHPGFTTAEVKDKAEKWFPKVARSTGVRSEGWYSWLTLFQNLRNVFCYAKSPVPKKKAHETWEKYRAGVQRSVSARLRLSDSAFGGMRLRIGMSSPSFEWNNNVMRNKVTHEVVELPEMYAWLRSRRNGSSGSDDE